MIIGKKLAATTNDVVVLASEDLERGSYHRLRVETSASFDRTITIKKRPHQDQGVSLTTLASWYRKESDGTTANAALTPGASNKSEYVIDGVAGVTTIEVTGGTAGTVDLYWSTVAG